MLNLWLTACQLLQNITFFSPNEPFYLVTVTSQTTGGSTETLCAHVLPKEPVSFTITMETFETNFSTLLEESVTTDFYHCLQFQVPPVVKDTVAVIHARIRGENIDLSKKTEILIKPSSSISIIQTDKPLYKPGQTVKFRIVSLDPNLLPYKQVYHTVEIQDPTSNRIAQWLNQSVSGILDLSHPTTSEAKNGVYTITALNEKGVQTTQSFEIIEFVLPKFEVTIHLPDAISSLDKEKTFKICGKYTYGKTVLGSVKATMCRKPTFSYSPWSQRCLRSSMRTDKTGCATETINVTNYSHLPLYSDTFTVEAEIEEDGTGVVLTGEGSTKFVTSGIFIKFEDAPSVYRPGINYEGKIILEGLGSTSVANKNVTLHARGSVQHKHWNLVTNNEGVAHFSLDTSNWLEDQYNLMANYHGLAGDTSVLHHVIAFYSRSKSFLQIKPVKEPFSCHEDAQVQVKYIVHGKEFKEKKTLDFFYLVLSKGSIVRNGRLSEALDNDEVKRGELSFSLKQTGDLAPYAQVVVYSLLPSGEIVVDSHDFPIQLCFKNKVSLQFSSKQELPGAKTFLEVQAQPGSLCSLRAIDKSLLLLKSDHELNVEMVYRKLPVQRLFRYPENIPDLEPSPCLPVPPMDLNEEPETPQPPEFHYIGYGHTPYKDAYTTFRGVGVKVLTNSKMKTWTLCQAPPSSGFGLVAEHPVAATVALGHISSIASAQSSSYITDTPKETVRTFFPETWIWKLVQVGDSGTAMVEETVPDTITKWVASGFCTSSEGFSLATNTVLTAFQPFFVSLTLPYSVIRGEWFLLKATVFNYLSKCIMVQVSVRESVEFTAQPCSGCQYKRCLCSEESETFSWVLTPASLGKVNITVSAEALNTEELCGNEVVTAPESGKIDTIVHTLLVEPAGTELTISHNALLCPKEVALEKVVSLELPGVFVEGSAKASVSVLGDIMGRAMKNLDGLLAMPYGCGEQNMLLFAPNIYILRYLEHTGQLTQEIKSKAITFLESGYQRELNYKHHDGSYSAFGNTDPSGNTWLTAFVMKSFGGAKPYIFIDPEHIARAKEWLGLQQQNDGCIRSVGRLFHNGMKGGVSDEVMLTAYVTAALLELGSNSSDPMVHRSLSCLKLAADQINSTYATALLSYTFTLAGDNDMRTSLLGHLDKLAKTTAQGHHWERAGAAGIDSLEVEMTSYVLLSLLSGPSLPGFDLDYSSMIVRWLIQQQNPYGGFSSTQDTVVALQALTLYAAATFSQEGASTVTVSSTGGYKSLFRVDQNNRLLYQEEQLQEVPGIYNIKAEGEACTFVQIALRYNIPPPPDSSSFTINATATGNCDGVKEQSLVVAVSVSYNGKREETNMVIISVRLLSGFVTNKKHLIVTQLEPTVRRVEMEDTHVTIYLDRLKRMELKTYLLQIQEEVPVRNLKPAVVKVYDYYDKSDEAVSEYTSPCAQSETNTL